MTDLSVDTELLNKGATDPLARRLVSSTFVIAGVLAVALIGAALGTPLSGSIDEAVAPRAFADLARRGAAPAVEVKRIVSADALGTDVSWSPRTGDGSN